MEIRREWLSLVDEEVVEPERRIIDAHHHFFVGSEGFPDYRLEHFLDCLSAHARIEGVEAVNGRQLIWFRTTKD